MFKIICKYGSSQPKSDESFCLPKQYLPTKFFEAQNHILAKGKKKPFNHYSLNFPFQRLLPVFFFLHTPVNNCRGQHFVFYFSAFSCHPSNCSHVDI